MATTGGIDMQVVATRRQEDDMASATVFQTTSVVLRGEIWQPGFQARKDFTVGIAPRRMSMGELLRFHGGEVWTVAQALADAVRDGDFRSARVAWASLTVTRRGGAFEHSRTVAIISEED